jgi:hypothetical protein
VPTNETCAFTVRAVGGFAYVRAVTTQCRTAIAPPIVDLRVNGEDGPVIVSASEPFTLSWSSLNAAECLASGAWSGVRAPDGEEEASATSTVTYTITCANGAGTASGEISAGSSRARSDRLPIGGSAQRWADHRLDTLRALRP